MDDSAMYLELEEQQGFTIPLDKRLAADVEDYKMYVVTNLQSFFLANLLIDTHQR